MLALSLIIYATGFFLVVIGFAWVPCAYRICYMNVASNKFIDARLYALIGALYSASMFLPWIYLIIKMSRREIPMSLIIATYIFQSMIWFSVNFSLWIGNNTVYNNYSNLVSLSIVIATLTWIVLLFTSNNKYMNNSYAVDRNGEYQPRIQQVLPFVWTTIWFIASIIREYPTVLFIISTTPIIFWASNFVLQHFLRTK